MRVDPIAALGLIQIIIDKLKAAFASGETSIEIDDIGAGFAPVNEAIQQARDADPEPGG